MISQNFNPSWTFANASDAARTTLVNLPHDAMQTEQRRPRMKDGSNSGFYPGGKYIYTKTLFGSPELAEKTVILEFDGVYMKSTVLLNGEEVGGRIYGYSRFHVDLSGRLRIGQQNEIKVLVDNTQTPNSRWYSGSGIYRNVRLLTAGRQHIAPDGVRVLTRSIHPAVLQVDVRAVDADSLQIVTEILLDGQVVAGGRGASCQIEVPDARLWDADHPHLYDVRVTLQDQGRIVDEARLRTGIRSLAWNAEQGLLVNGQAVKLRGGCIHHDNGPLGACSFEKAERRKMKIMKAAGFNAIRTAHNPASQALLDACDEVGMYVMHEAFDTWRLKKTDYDYGLYFDAEWEKDVTAMVAASWNHPAVILYSIGNEIPDTGTPAGAETSRRMVQLCHQLDPSRPVTNCIQIMLASLASMGSALNKSVTSPADVVDPYREAADSRAAGSTMANILVTLAPILMKVIGTPEKAEKVAGASFAALDIAGYNYAEYAYKKHHAWHPERVMVGSETMPRAIARNWKMVEQTPFVIGDFMWTGWDYLGEAGLGLPVYGQSRGPFSKPYPCVSASCGCIDLTGQMDSLGYYAVVGWGVRSIPYIGVRPLNHTGEKVFMGMWRGTDAVDSWSWAGQAGRPAEIEVFSIGESVELIQDGQSLGRRGLVDCKTKFKTTYRPGELLAVSYDADGKEIGRSSLKSAGKETVLTVLPEEDAINADGQDLAYIAVHLSDAAGIPKMMEDRTVTVEVQGAASLAAVGSANPLSEEPYTGASYTTYQGRMIAILRSNGQRGPIRVKFSSDGLESREIVLQAR